MKLVVDHCLGPAWVAFLRANGVEAVAWQDVGDPAAEDERIIEWAKKQKAVILTGDADFGRLLSDSGESSPSTIRISTNENRPQFKGGLVLGILREHAGLLEAGAFVSLDQKSARVRALPLAGRRTKTPKEPTA